ncbi:hypothetical protein SVIOM342S_07558 [Streptomyces violaceorubidus]
MSRQGRRGSGRPGRGTQRMTAEGRAEQSKGDARQAKEKGKDAFRH